MTRRILPLVPFAPEHVDAAAGAGMVDLLEQMLDQGVCPTPRAYQWVGYAQGGPEVAQTLDLLICKGAPSRLGTGPLLEVMHHLKASHIAAALEAASARFNREKLLARAIRSGNDSVARELSATMKITARVALRAIGERITRHAQDGSLEGTAARLAQLHRETDSIPFSARATARLVCHAVRRYIEAFTPQQAQRLAFDAPFRAASEQLLSLSYTCERGEILMEVLNRFRIRRDHWPDAKQIERLKLARPASYAILERFHRSFEGDLLAAIERAVPTSREHICEPGVRP